LFNTLGLFFLLSFTALHFFKDEFLLPLSFFLNALAVFIFDSLSLFLSFSKFFHLHLLLKTASLGLFSLHSQSVFFLLLLLLVLLLHAANGFITVTLEL